MTMNELAKKTKDASSLLQGLSEETRVLALKKISEELLKNKLIILDQNQIDLEEARENKISAANIDRLTLTDKAVNNSPKCVLM